MKPTSASPSRFSYASPGVPKGYECSTCGAHGCKLWREYQTLLDHQTLECADCAGKSEKMDVSEIRDDGKRPLRYGVGGGAEWTSWTDQIGWRVPAVPTEDGSSSGVTRRCRPREPCGGDVCRRGLKSIMTEKQKLTLHQVRALERAREHGVVIIGKGYGRDGFTPNAVASRTYVRLVMLGLLTPRPDRKRYEGHVLHIETGKSGWLTQAGEDELTRRPRD